MSRRRRPLELDWIGVVLGAVLLGTLALCSGCYTAEAIRNLPEGWWLGLESVLLGLWQDVVSMVDLLL